MVNRQLGRLAEAEQCCRKAVELAPGIPVTHQALGVILHQKGCKSAALEYFRKAIELQPDLFEARYFLANALEQLGRVDAAVAEYRALLNLEPNHPGALNRLGNLLRDLGVTDEAIDLLEHANRVCPGDADTLVNIAEAWVVKGSSERAIDYLQRAILLNPDSFNAYWSLGNTLHGCGRLREALSAYENALRLQPSTHKVTISQAMVHARLGEYEQAYKILQPLLDQGIKNAVIPFFDISQHIGMREEAVAMTQEQLTHDVHDESELSALHFRLGGHFDHVGRYDEAFRHYAHANANARVRHGFDIKQVKSQFDKIIEVYNESFTHTMPHSTELSSQPVFIVGMPRSGSSLAEQILAHHPEVYGAGELPDIYDAAIRLGENCNPRQPFPVYIPQINRETLDDISGRYIKKLTALSHGEPVITDKMPHNFMFVGFIAQLFPSARIIHCIRNPLDNCLSCYFAEFGSSGHNYANNLEDLGNYYVQYQRLMTHWNTVLDFPILEFSYEVMVQDQERMSRKMVEYCGLTWDPRCMEFYKSERTAFTLSYDQVRQPIHRKSMGRWRHYEAYIDALRATLDRAGIIY